MLIMMVAWCSTQIACLVGPTLGQRCKHWYKVGPTKLAIGVGGVQVVKVCVICQCFIVFVNDGQINLTDMDFTCVFTKCQIHHSKNPSRVGDAAAI